MYEGNAFTEKNNDQNLLIITETDQYITEAAESAWYYNK